MNGLYVGVVAESDPLQVFLGRLLDEPRPVLHAFQLHGTNEVYAYEEETSGARVVCKFYGPLYGWDRDRAAWMAAQEFRNLTTLRGFDLAGSPHRVIRPLGFAGDINGVLATEYAGGEQLSEALGRASPDELRQKLTSLAFFLATLHDRTANGARVNFAREGAYLDSLVERLANRGRMPAEAAEELTRLRDRWLYRARMWQDRQVWLHGDATPANFLFGPGLDVTAIDLERMKRGDRAFDVGRVAGELLHALDDAEPFVTHFVREYCACAETDFTTLNARLPYYAGLNQLRIAGNTWIDDDYAFTLVNRARTLLRAP